MFKGSRKKSWQKSLEVFDETVDRTMRLRLFPEDRPLPADGVDAIGGQAIGDGVGSASFLWKLLVGLLFVGTVAVESVLV